MTLIERLNQPTPPFFKKVKTAGKFLTLLGGGILALAASLATAGMAVPAIILTAGTVLTSVGGTVISVASVVTHDVDTKNTNQNQ